MEPRVLLATFSVMNTGDAGSGSLRDAITQANANPGADAIVFDSGGTGTIQLYSSLPAITDPVTIDGTSSPGYAGAPVVVLDGTNAGVNVDGLSLDTGSAGSTIVALAIQHFTGNGVAVQSSGNAILGSYIGIDAAGSDVGNGGSGVLLAAGASDSTIGGSAPTDRNVISGNTGNGVLVMDGASGNLLQGNLVGTDAAGTAALGNGGDGVMIAGAAGNLIRSNVLAGNAGNGLAINGASASGNVLTGNLIGTDAGGSGVVPNRKSGVLISDAPANLVGGAAAGDGNMIVGNAQSGVSIANVAAQTAADAVVVDGNRVTGNGLYGILLNASPGQQIVNNMVAGNSLDGIRGVESSGLMIAGNTVLGSETGAIGSTDPNGPVQRDGIVLVGPSSGQQIVRNRIDGALRNGILLVNVSDATIGSATAADRNILTNNLGNGIAVSGGSGVRIIGNLVGVDSATPTAGAGNSGNGILLQAAVNATVGGTAPGEANIIAANVGSGIAVTAGSTGARVLGNTVGLVIGGGAQPLVLGNSGNGIAVSGGSDGAVVRGNAIVASLGSGVAVDGSSGVLIAGNLIGQAAPDDAPELGNSGDGVTLRSAPGNTIGGASAADRNVIAGNFGSGLSLLLGSSGNLIVGNDIGVASDGTTAAGNLQDGITLAANSGDNTIGGADAGLGNVISANRKNGITAVDRVGDTAGSGRNLILGNMIGTDAAATADLGNTLNGLFLQSDGNTIGGDGAGRNVISGNDLNGVALVGAGAVDNRVLNNRIGTNGDGVARLGNAQAGVLIDGGTGNQIGDAGAGNVISANGSVGVQVANVQPGSGTGGTAILGNKIGTDLNGTAGLGNVGDGILVIDSLATTIGGAGGAANVILDNGGSGVEVFDQPGTAARASGNLVLGNMIGLATDGKALGNRSNGVFLNLASNNTVGMVGLGNTIAGSGDFGLLVTGASGNRIQANLVGTLAGDPAAANALGGISLFNAPVNLVGGTIEGERNMVVGNAGDGIAVIGPKTEAAEPSRVYGNLVASNRGVGIRYVDAAIAGGSQVGPASNDVMNNGGAGIVLSGLTAPSGDAEAGLRALNNQVVGNGGDGVQLLNAPGARAVGNTVKSNGMDGFLVVNSPGAEVSSNVIGAENAGNLGDGASVSGSPGLIVTGSVFQENRGIGLAISGSDGASVTDTKILSSGGDGLRVTNSSGVVIGGDAPSDRIDIDGNGGVGLQAQGATGLRVTSGVIGGSGDEGIVLDRSNGAVVQGVAVKRNGRLSLADGIRVVGSTDVTIGGSSPGQGNVIIGQSQGAGVRLVDANASTPTSRVLIQGNTIGYTGTEPFEGNLVGIALDDVSQVTVGGSVGAGGNAIAGNLRSGIEVAQGANNRGASSVTIIGNDLGTLDGATLPEAPAQHPGSVVQQPEGVVLTNTVGVTVGSATFAERNVISGNDQTGVRISGSLARDNVVLGNIIGGADNPALGAIGMVDTRAGAPASSRIAPITSAGVPLDPVPFSTITLINGRFLFVPLQAQVQDQGLSIEETYGNTVLGNAIAYDSVGVQLKNTPDPESVEPAGSTVSTIYVPNRVQGNVIFRNLNGVYLDQAAGNVIGLAPAPAGQRGFGNRIERNVSTGVTLFGMLSLGNFVTGNQIAATPPEDFVPPAGVSPDIGSGVFIDGASITLSTQQLANEQAALSNLLQGRPAALQNIQRNYIGLGTTGGGLGNVITGRVSNLPPSVAGVFFFDNANGNVVQGNTIASSRFGALLIDSTQNLDEVARNGPNANIFRTSEGDVVAFAQGAAVSGTTATTTAPAVTGTQAAAQRVPAGPRGLLRRG